MKYFVRKVIRVKFRCFCWKHQKMLIEVSWATKLLIKQVIAWGYMNLSIAFIKTSNKNIISLIYLGSVIYPPFFKKFIFWGKIGSSQKRKKKKKKRGGWVQIQYENQDKTFVAKVTKRRCVSFSLQSYETLRFGLADPLKQRPWPA